MKFNLNIKKYVFVGAAILCLSTSSCINDLDQNPIIGKASPKLSMSQTASLSSPKFIAVSACPAM